MADGKDPLPFEPRVCTAELLCAEPAAFSEEAREALLGALRAAFGDVTVLRSEDAALHLALDDCPAEHEGGEKVPARILLMGDASSGMNPDPEKTREILETSLAQTWNWDEAGEAAASAPYKLLVSDFSAADLDPKRRISVFSAALRAVAGVIPHEALHFPASQCLVKPEAFLEGVLGGEGGYPLLGLVNVRFFTVEGAEDEIVMDTLGLHVFGLPDAQCHCSGVESGELAGWLYSLAAYIAGTDGEIEEDCTVSGFGDFALRMRYEESLVPPRRVVLDLQPVDEERDG